MLDVVENRSGRAGLAEGAAIAASSGPTRRGCPADRMHRVKFCSKLMQINLPS
jgi:hypothetical protein